MERFRLTPAALLSLVSIGRYTQLKWGKEQRNTYLRQLNDRFHELAASPDKGRICDEIIPGIRSYKQGKHIIFYTERDNSVIIIDILHERMDPALHLSLQKK